MLSGDRTIAFFVVGRLRELMGIPEALEVWLAPRTREDLFGDVPESFIPTRGVADYIVTGPRSAAALNVAARTGLARCTYSGEVDGAYVGIPEDDELRYSSAARYVHYTSNNSLVGSQFHDTPRVNAPLVADMSTDLLSRPQCFDRFDLIYADSQACLDVPGGTFVIARPGFLARALPGTPLAPGGMARRSAPPDVQAGVRSALEGLAAAGGPEEMERQGAAKAALLYTAIDYSENFYMSPIPIESRSLIDAAVCTPSPEFETQLLNKAHESGPTSSWIKAQPEGLLMGIGPRVHMTAVESFVDLLEDFRQAH